MECGYISRRFDQPQRTPPPMPYRIPASQLAQHDADRICIIKPSALGDVVQALPVLGALRRRFPRAAISWVINAEFTNLLNGHPELAEVIPFRRKGSAFDFIGILRGLK